MNDLFKHVIVELFKENWLYFTIVFIIAILTSVIQTNGISVYTAEIVDTISKLKSNIWTSFYILALLYCINQVLNYTFWQIHNTLTSEIKPWARWKLLDTIMNVNSHVFSEVNFAKLNTPIHRIADLLSSIVSDVIAYFLPNLIFVIIISIYLFKIDSIFPAMFFVGNIFIIAYYFISFNTTLKANLDYENTFQKSDGVLIDLLSNLDKIIYRGNVPEESNKYKKLSEENGKLGANYFCTANTNATIMTSILLFIFLGSFGYLINLYLNKKINNIEFITTITILTMFRERLDAVLTQIPDFIMFFGRTQIAMEKFQHVNKHLNEVLKKNKDKSKKLKFDKIIFKDIHYKYSTGKTIFENSNYEIYVKNNSIIGITGPSGSGKSTLMKLFIKMYPLEKGNIYIDNVNIKDISAEKIRKHVTYVNQTAKLFDDKVINNMLYGCIDHEKCDLYLQKIMKYPNIAKLYENIDIKKKDAGLLGENLSGGQRQVINMISGLINPSEILILDEPTNALDPKLKAEIIQIIQDFKKYKKAIFIITHDKEVFEIFDQQIKIQN